MKLHTKETKIRAYHIEGNFMGHVLTLDLLNGGACVSLDEIGRDGASEWFSYRTTILNKKEPEILLREFTGVKDSQGRDIYHGDIVKIVTNEYTTITYCDYVTDNFTLFEPFVHPKNE